eukprot:SAG11_NODE_1543_length_4716_cov_6.357375_5_plen_102_part_00
MRANGWRGLAIMLLVADFIEWTDALGDRVIRQHLDAQPLERRVVAWPPVSPARVLIASTIGTISLRWNQRSTAHRPRPQPCGGTGAAPRSAVGAAAFVQSS